jgi:hypothetical protein
MVAQIAVCITLIKVAVPTRYQVPTTAVFAKVVPRSLSSYLLTSTLAASRFFQSLYELYC